MEVKTVKTRKSTEWCKNPSKRALICHKTVSSIRAAHPSKILSDHALHLTRVSNSIEMPIYANNFILSAL